MTFLISCGTLSVIQWRSCDTRKGGYNDGLRIFACRFALEGFPVPRNTNALKAENRPLWECTPIIRMRQVRPSLKGEMRLFNQFAHRHWASSNAPPPYLGVCSSESAFVAGDVQGTEQNRRYRTLRELLRAM